jgi:hypothetical protein
MAGRETTARSARPAVIATLKNSQIIAGSV